MTILSGTNPSITCYTFFNSIETQVNSPSSTKFIVFSTLYSDINCTNKIGITIEEIVETVNSSNVIIKNYNGTFLFDKFGNINFESTTIKESEEKIYIDQIVFGTDDFLNSRGFKYTLLNVAPDTNLCYIWIDGA
jgi:hypothetical protein